MYINSPGQYIGTMPAQMHGPFKKFGKWVAKGTKKTVKGTVKFVDDTVTGAGDAIADLFQEAREAKDEPWIDRTTETAQDVMPAPMRPQTSGPIDPNNLYSIRPQQYRTDKTGLAPEKFTLTMKTPENLSAREIAIKKALDFDPKKINWKFGEEEPENFVTKNMAAIATGAAAYRILTGGGL